MKQIKRLLSASFAALGMLALCNCSCCNTGARADTGEKGTSAACCTSGAACCVKGAACCAAPTAKKS